MMAEHMQIIWEKSVTSVHAERVKLIESTIFEIEKEGLSVALDKYELYLVLDEAISNAMEHGNKWSKLKTVKVEFFKKNDDSLIVSVYDEGQGFNSKNVGEKRSEDDRLSLRGRGIFIMQTFCKIEWNERGNNIRLQLPLSN
ncbi:MAG: ATP-binding protein [Leptospirales bacterium]